MIRGMGPVSAHALVGASDARRSWRGWTPLLVVGNVNQLPSTGPGQMLANVSASGAVRVVRLTEMFRQAARSRIITNAHRINQGQLPELTAPDGSGYVFVEAPSQRTQSASCWPPCPTWCRSVGARPGSRRAGAAPDER